MRAILVLLAACLSATVLAADSEEATPFPTFATIPGVPTAGESTAAPRLDKPPPPQDGSAGQTGGADASAPKIGFLFPWDYAIFQPIVATAAITTALIDSDLQQYLVSITYAPGSVIATLTFNSQDALSVLLSIPITIDYLGEAYVPVLVDPLTGLAYESNTGTAGNTNGEYNSNTGNSNAGAGSETYSGNTGNAGSSGSSENTWTSNAGTGTGSGAITFTSDNSGTNYVNLTINGHTIQLLTLDGVKDQTQQLEAKVEAQGAIALALATGTTISAETFCAAFPAQCDCDLFPAACPAGKSSGTSAGAATAGIVVGVVVVVVLVAVVAIVIVSRRNKAKLVRRRVSDSSVSGLLPTARPSSTTIHVKSFSDTVEV